MDLQTPDLIASERFSALSGSPVLFCEANVAPDPISRSGVIVAVDRTGNLPEIDEAVVDAAVTIADCPPAPWVGVAPERLDAKLAIVSANVSRAPVATAVLARQVRIQEHLGFSDAIEVESLAYSALLGGNEFKRWLQRRRPTGVGDQAQPPVRFERDGDLVRLTLSSPTNSNAMTAVMRDALFEALVNVLEDPSGPRVELDAEGRSFSTGGDLPEFGTARDLARAHIIRTLRSCTNILHRLGSRAIVRLNGACIGSGIEIPAAATKVIGTRSTFVQLPELKMGLIPGAGGTVSLSRRIGRHRLMWLCLGGFRLGADAALDWGLLDAIDP